MNIFILEDDQAILEPLVWALKDKNYEVQTASSNEDAFKVIQSFSFQDPLICLLDIKIHNENSFPLISHIREKALKNWGIIMLTALQDEKFMEKAFTLGADDFVRKPFSSAELIYRIEALIKRLPKYAKESVTLADHLEIHWSAHKIITPSGSHFLSPKEMKAFELFYDNLHQTITRDQILNIISPENLDSNPRSVDNYIVKFRKILEEGSLYTFKSIRGLGYQLTRKEP